MTTIKTAVFDLEIKKQILPAAKDCTEEEINLVAEDLAVHGWDNAHNAGISSGVVYDLERKRYHLFGDTYEEHFIMAELLTEAEQVVGFNHVNFDYPLLACSIGRPLCEITDLEAKPGERDLDLLQMAWAGHGSRVFGHGFGLDALSQATLGEELGGKNGCGEHAPVLYQKGRWGELLNYNYRDVELTARLWEFMREYGYLLRYSSKKLFKIAWEHPQEWYPR